MEISKNGEDKYSFRVLLKEANPYFVYNLDFPLLDDENKVTTRKDWKELNSNDEGSFWIDE